MVWCSDICACRVSVVTIILGSPLDAVIVAVTVTGMFVANELDLWNDETDEASLSFVDGRFDAEGSVLL
jgi:hypothetical protein